MDMLLGKKHHLSSMSPIKVPTETRALLSVLATTRCNCVSIVVRLSGIKSSSHSSSNRWQRDCCGAALIWKSNFCDSFINVCTAPASGPYAGALSFQQSSRPCNFFGHQAQITSASKDCPAFLPNVQIDAGAPAIQAIRRKLRSFAVQVDFPMDSSVLAREAVPGLRSGPLAVPLQQYIIN